MFLNKKIIAIVPARGGSVGLPDKNIKIINGKPMIAHSLEKALKVKELDKLIVSTDDKKIAGIAKKYGAAVPFLRDKMLARNDTPMNEVILDAISKMRDAGEEYDYAIMLQANSPLIRIEDIHSVLRKIIKEKLDVVFTVAEIHHPPQWALKVKDNDVKFAFLKDRGKKIVQRQKEEVLYRSTGAVYAVRISYLLNKRSKTRLCLPATGQRTGAVITDMFSSVDIDNELDFYLADTIFKLERIKECQRRKKQ